MDECKSNQSSSNASPLFQQQFHQTNINNYFLYDDNDLNDINNNTGRLSKVTEENSLYSHNNNNNNNNIVEQDEDENEEEISLRLLYPSTNNNNMRNYHQLHQHNRHNNTPHGNEDEQNILFNTTPTPTPIDNNTFIPERIRLLLDRFAANGYIISNAPPPANQSIIDKIPEIIVDKKFIKDNNNEDIEFECAICKIQIEVQQKIKILSCKHYFHSRCITTWLQIHASCPLCRRKLNIKQNEITETMRTEDAQTRAMMNRLRDLRQRRRSRRTLRNYNSNTSTSGNHTPRPNNNSNNIQHAATQLIHGIYI